MRPVDTGSKMMCKRKKSSIVPFCRRRAGGETTGAARVGSGRPRRLRFDPRLIFVDKKRGADQSAAAVEMRKPLVAIGAAIER